MAGIRPDALALSPGGKQIAVLTDAGVSIIDPESGDTLAALPGQFGFAKVSFSDDGTRLGMISGNRLIVWSLKDGSTYRDFILSVDVGMPTIDWVSKDYLLISGRWLIDIDAYLPLWEYQQHGADEGTVFAEHYWYVAQQGNVPQA